jgi:hypothetical protein
MRDNIVETSFDIKEEGRCFHACLLSGDHFLFEGEHCVCSGDAWKGAALVWVNK